MTSLFIVVYGDNGFDISSVLLTSETKGSAAQAIGV